MTIYRVNGHNARGIGMLVTSRREGETLLIGDDIEIVIVHLGRARVRVGIRAPREYRVTPGEDRAKPLAAPADKAPAAP